MQRIVLFGKGGIGKTTVAVNLAAAFALAGKKVILIGCDPKHDTTSILTGGKPITTVCQRILEKDAKNGFIRELIVPARMGIDCVEAGGPEPGVGCAGRGISQMLDFFAQDGILERGAYDVALFDVLGDVVCGGFAAPLRQGFADKVCLVVSDENMALYAANNIARAIRTYADNGIALLGLIANMSAQGAGTSHVKGFARLLGTPVIGSLEYDPLVAQAERRSLSVLEHAPRSKTAARFRRLANAILAADKDALPLPTPLSDGDFHALAMRGFKGLPQDAPSLASIPASAPSCATICDPPRPPERPRQPRSKLIAPPLDRDPGLWHTFFMQETGNPPAPWEPLLDSPSVVFIQHGDIECSCDLVLDGGRTQSLLGHPWLGRRRADWGAKRTKELVQYISNINERDILLSPRQRMDALADRVAERARGADLVILDSLCLPMVTGDDMHSLLDACRRRCACPVIHISPEGRDYYEILDEVRGALLPTPRPLKAVHGRPVVDLLGFPASYRGEELSPLLGRLGVSINLAAVPEVDAAAFKAYRPAPLQVVCGDTAHGEVIERLFGKLPTRTLKVAPPYGPDAAEACLMAIAREFGLEKKASMLWKEHLASRAPALPELRARAARAPLTLIVDQGLHQRLLSGRDWCGVPLAGMLRGLGFPLRYLVHSDGARRPSAAADTDFFDSPAGLEALLARPEHRCVYSDLFADARLSRAGKAQFGLRDLEMGLLGAVRSLENLLGAVELPFYRDYGEYLQGAG